MNHASLYVLALLSALGSASTHADEVTDGIKASLEKSSPSLRIKSIQPSPVSGLYEVFAGGKLFYVDKGGNYVLSGATMFDLASKRNLTAERMQKLTSIQFSALPLKDAIEVKKGNGGYKFAVFSDPDCPFCQRLEQAMEQSGLTDYTAYIFLMPLESLHKEARWKSEAVWCATDRAAAWNDLMLKRKTPKKTTCQNPIDSIQKLADSIGVAATPSIYLHDGSLAYTPEELFSAIRQGGGK
jgi:thiol:disulfide interchange protein DsbC